MVVTEKIETGQNWRCIFMWLFSKTGFYSVVKKDCKPDEVLVRTRQKIDLVRLLNYLGIRRKIKTNFQSDYRFRAVIPERAWLRYLIHAALSIDYGNFKETVPVKDWQRHTAYLKVWEILRNWQEEEVVQALPQFKNGRKKINHS
jgi:hypothetical protein